MSASHSPLEKSTTRSLRSRDKSQMREFVNAIEKGVIVESPSTFTMRRPSEGKRKSKDNHVTVSSLPKRRKVIGFDGVEYIQDAYCWECHEPCVPDGVECSTCPRSFHKDCLVQLEKQTAKMHECSTLDQESSENWSCPVCEVIGRAECVDTRSWSVQQISMDEFAVLLEFALNRMRHKDSAAFHEPVPKDDCLDYYEYIFHPMDLGTIEKNVQRKIYASTEAFIEDAKWLLHNCIIYNGPSSKFTTDCKLIMKICKYETSEIELCPTCYLNSCLRKDDWFAEPCNYPHCLVWAKLRGYPYWPAKALRVSKGNVDVRFFGAHDRSWIALGQVYLLSEEPPQPVKNPKKWKGLDEANVECQKHCQLLEDRFGEFSHAEAHTEFKPDYLYNCPILFGEKLSKRLPKRQRHASDNNSDDESEASGHSQLISRMHYRKARASPTPVKTPDEQSASLAPTRSKSTDSTDEQRPRLIAKFSMKGSGSDTNTEGVFILNDNMQAEMDRCLSVKAESEKKYVSSERKMGVEKVAGGEPSDVNETCLERISASLNAGSNGIEHLHDPDVDEGSDEDDMMDDLDDDEEMEMEFTAPDDSSIDEPQLSLAPPPSVTLSQHQPVVSKYPQIITQASLSTLTSVKKKSIDSILHKKLSTIASSSSSNHTPNSFGMPTTSARAAPVTLESYQHKISNFIRDIFHEISEDFGNSAANGQTYTKAASPTDRNEKILELQAEAQKMRWLHNQAISELKQSTTVALSEVWSSFESEKKRAIEQVKEQMEAEKTRAINEAKSKQWCVQCGKEAQFYCCWNTSYCDYPCQQKHWTKHQESCAQIRQSEATGTPSMSPFASPTQSGTSTLPSVAMQQRPGTSVQYMPPGYGVNNRGNSGPARMMPGPARPGMNQQSNIGSYAGIDRPPMQQRR